MTVKTDIIAEYTNDTGVTVDGVLIKDGNVDGVDVSALGLASHAAVTLDANADTLLSLITQTVGLDTQAANRALLGPVSGVAAAPTFRALVSDDVPALDHGSKLSGLADDDHTQYLLATGTRTGASSQAQAFTNGLVAPALKPAADSATALQLQTAGGTAVLNVDTTNQIVSMRGTQSTAPLGAELVTNGTFATNDFTGWTAGANWSAATGKAVHTAGSVETLAQNISVVSGTTYQIAFAISDVSAGSVAVALGAVALIDSGASTAFAGITIYNRTLVAGATGSLALTFTPSNNFAGALDGISVKAITGTANPIMTWLDNVGGVVAHVRGVASLGNHAFGVAALQSNTTGSYNTASGSGALYANTTGSGNTASGSAALYANTTGSDNTASGRDAGRYQADGTSALTDAENSVYIGAGARGYNNDDSNSIVIGYQAVGLGANTSVIGNTSTVLTAFPGGALQITEMSAPTGTANNATIYARDSGGGKTVLCCKLGDNVEIVLATQA